ncbi:hypothetical protein FRC02_001878 [Tulasnella sp. 418]|nr:hypothetical protein FRC02_001878 [Tulasnella sp. 418]
MAGRYSPPPHPPRAAAFNPLAHLLKHLADSPPTTPLIFTPTDLENNPATHDPEDILRELRADGENPFPIDRNQLRKLVNKKLNARVETIAFLSSGTSLPVPSVARFSLRLTDSLLRSSVSQVLFTRYFFIRHMTVVIILMLLVVVRRFS